MQGCGSQLADNITGDTGKQLLVIEKQGHLALLASFTARLVVVDVIPAFSIEWVFNQWRAEQYLHMPFRHADGELGDLFRFDDVALGDIYFINSQLGQVGHFR